MAKKAILALVLIALVLIGGGLQASEPYTASSLEAVAEPHRFAVARWEVSHLAGSLFQIPRSAEVPSVRDPVELVRSYFQQSGDIGWLRLQLELKKVGDTEQYTIKGELLDLEQKQSQDKGEVMAVLESQFIDSLREHGLDTSLLWGNIRFVFPPLRFEMQPLPQVLIVSPRDQIATVYSDLLRPDLTPEEAEAIEAEVAKLGYSGLVEHIGGLATYPSLLPDTMSLEGALSTIAHEWAHQFLFFYPLGRQYNTTYEMTIINETTADIIGNEIGQDLYRLYGANVEGSQVTEQSSTAGETGFNFYRAMRETRLTVDSLLAEGKTEEAEQYMEERRLYINAQGYWIRKLNQAYFAFHGSYGEGPAASSPIGGQLRALREQSTSLGEFVRKVAGISSYEGFQALVPK